MASFMPPSVVDTSFAILPPHDDLCALLERLGSKLFARDQPIVQYVAWAVLAGLFEMLARPAGITCEDVSREGALNVRGADAILGVLAALGLATTDRGTRYRIAPIAREYLLPSSRFFIGHQLYAPRSTLPHAYRSATPSGLAKMQHRALNLLPTLRYGSKVRLQNQHVRNLPACVSAVNTGEFENVRCLVDLAGGSGPFSIPLALKYPSMRIVLAELPRALNNIRDFLVYHKLESKVELVGIDALGSLVALPESDGIFIGNFLHGFSDSTCRRVLRECRSRICSGGKVWIHEMVWNDNKDGPLLTALWNAAIRNGPGKQRTTTELAQLLRDSGFLNPYVVSTSLPFALVVGRTT